MPSGSPAPSKIRAIDTPPLTAVRRSGLRTTAFPSASAGATERMARIRGRLNGAMTPTTPTGRRPGKPQTGLSGGQDLAGRTRGQRRLVAFLGGHVSLSRRFGHHAARSRTGQPSTSEACSSHKAPARRKTAARSS